MEEGVEGGGGGGGGRTCSGLAPQAWSGQVSSRIFFIFSAFTSRRLPSKPSWRALQVAMMACSFSRCSISTFLFSSTCSFFSPSSTFSTDSSSLRPSTWPVTLLIFLSSLSST